MDLPDVCERPSESAESADNENAPDSTVNTEACDTQSAAVVDAPSVDTTANKAPTTKAKVMTEEEMDAQLIVDGDLEARVDLNDIVNL